MFLCHCKRVSQSDFDFYIPDYTLLLPCDTKSETHVCHRIHIQIGKAQFKCNTGSLNSVSDTSQVFVLAINL